MVQEIEMTKEEQMTMYMKCSKKELCKMLIEINSYLKTLPIPVVVGQSEQIECDKCKYIAIYDGYEINYLECLKCGKTKAY
jgi:hypothetical protein